jgi:hypothetical protein
MSKHCFCQKSKLQGRLHRLCCQCGCFEPFAAKTCVYPEGGILAHIDKSVPPSASGPSPEKV